MQFPKLFTVGLILSLISPIDIRADDPAATSVAPINNQAPSNFTDVLKTNSLELIEWAKQSAQKTGDFAAEQTPFFIQEYVAWIFWSNLLYFIAFLVPTLAILWISIKFFNKITGWSDREEYITNEKNERELKKATFGANNVLFMVFTMFSMIMTAIFFANAPKHAALSIKSFVAPRVLIVDKLTEIVKSK